MVSIPDSMEPQDKIRRVSKKQFQIKNCIQITAANNDSDNNYFKLTLRLYGQSSGSDVHCVSVTAEQLLDYRLLQQAALKQTGALIVDDDEFELGDVGLWPLRLASLLGGAA